MMSSIAIYAKLSWIAIPFILFLFIDSWFVDYISPIVTALIAFSYLCLAIFNYKLKRFKLDLIKTGIATTFSLILFGISFSYTNEIMNHARVEISKLKNNICNVSIDLTEGQWEVRHVNNGLLSIKINYIFKDNVVEIRSSPLIFGNIEGVYSICNKI